MTNKPIHTRDLVTALPLSKIMPPEMRVLFREWISEDENRINLGKEEYLQDFQNWYSQRETLSKAWADYSESPEDRSRHLSLNPRIARKVQSIPERASILDIGCGIGDAVVPYLKNEQTYLGLDSSTYCLSRLRQKHSLGNISLGETKPRDIKFTLFGALPSALPFPQPHIFDEVLCNMTLNHVQDLQTSIDSIFSLLKTQGSFFISTYDADKINPSTLPEQLRSSGLFYHSTSQIYHKLKEYSSKVRIEDNGGIFKIFEGRAR